MIEKYGDARLDRHDVAQALLITQIVNFIVQSTRAISMAVTSKSTNDLL